MATFKILSIDGGGIRGIIPAYWLTRLEAELKAKANLTLHEVFDLFAGTSTGSIIAAGLAIGRSANEILKLYEEKGSKIFPTPLLRNPLRYWGTFLPAYSGAGLDEVLESEFQTIKFGEVKKHLLITAFDGGSRMLKLFDSNQHQDKPYLLRDIVRGSCAAPTYLPAKEMEINGVRLPLLDGGIAANNPAALALAKAFKEQHPPEDVLLVSLGTGVSELPITIEQGKGRGKAQWARPIVEVMFDGSSSSNEILIEHVLPHNSYFRLQKRDLVTDSTLDRTDGAHLKALQNEAKAYLDHESTRFEQLVEALTKPNPPPSLALDGIWESKYTWNEEGKLRENEWPEKVALQVSGQRVTGETIESKFPFRLRGKIQGIDFLGYTISRDKPFKLSTSFVLRMNVDTEKELNGHWVGTGHELYTGEWKLTRPLP